MTVKEIITLSAELLGREDVVQGLTTENYKEESEREKNLLLRCFNLIENEIALDYFPMKKEEDIKTKNGVFYYTALSRVPVKICDVKDCSKNKIKYKVYSEYLTTCAENVIVEYSYAPNVKTLKDIVEVNASERVISYGVACEYMLIKGLYEEALMWDKKYKDALLCANAPHRSLVIKPRSWL